MPNPDGTPTQSEINMYDLNGDGVLDHRDVELAKQVGSTAIANAITNILEGQEAKLNLSQSMTESEDVVTGNELNYMISASANVETTWCNLTTNALPLATEFSHTPVSI